MGTATSASNKKKGKFNTSNHRETTSTFGTYVRNEVALDMSTYKFDLMHDATVAGGPSRHMLHDAR